MDGEEIGDTARGGRLALGRQWMPVIASVLMLVASVTYVVLWATGPAGCAVVDVRPQDWTAVGVVVEATEPCPLHSGDLVTAVGGHDLAAAETAGTWTSGQQAVYDVVRDGRELTATVTLGEPDLAGTLGAAWPTLLFVVSLLGVSGYVTWRRPAPATNALLILASGLGASTLPVLLGLPVVGVLDPWQRWLYLGLTQLSYHIGWSGALTFALLFPRPYGRPAAWPRRARWALYSAPVTVPMAWGALAAPGSGNPLEWTGRLIAGASLVVVVTLLVVIGISVSRLRRSREAVEQQQMRWLVGSGALASSAGLAGWFVPELLIGEGLPTRWIGLAALPFVIGLGVAVSRYRLFDLDVVLNRGLVYGLLTASVVTVYLVVVAAAAAVTRGESATAASIVAAAAVAVAVNPLRVMLQRGVGRMLYGDRDDPYSAMRRLDRRLDDTGDTERLLPAVAEDLADALRVPYVAIDAEPVARPVEAGSRPRWLADDRSLLELPLVDRGERIGRLLVAPRTPNAPFSAADRRLLDDLARRVSATVRELGLRADLQRSRERLVLAREEERRRLRRALHDDVGPSIAGLGLRTEAARRLVETDPAGAAAVLAEVRDGSQELVGDIRRLAYDLRPPALDEFGLVGALRQYADGIKRPAVTVRADGVGELPAAVEAAAYRIAVEAVTNAVRHADASRCEVGLRGTDGVLEVRVADDGRGLPAEAHAGVGMSAMVERTAELGGSLRVEPGNGSGVCVIASLPIRRDGT